MISPKASDRSIKHEKSEVSEEDVEKKAIQTIYTRLKQAACDKTRWRKVEKLFEYQQYKRHKRSIIEKLDDDTHFAPIHYAVRSNNEEVCKNLLSSPYKCNVNLLGQGGQTPLHIAACSSEIEKDKNKTVLLMLLNHKNIRINIQDDKKRTPLHYAIMHNHSAIANKLLECKANPYACDNQKATPFHYAYRFGKDTAIYSLFPLDTRVWKMKTIDDKTPFELACEYNNKGAIKNYIQNSSSQFESHYSIRTLIHSAVRLNDMEILNHLVLTEDMISYILRLVCHQPNAYQCIKQSNISNLFTKEVMSKSISKDGFTPLMTVVKYRVVDAVKDFIVDKYCDEKIWKSSSYDFERTVLHICAEFPDKSITDSLLEKAKKRQFNLQPIDVMGNTPLHICVQNNNKHMCKELLSIGKNLETMPSQSKYNSNRKFNNFVLIPSMLLIRNNNGLTAFHEAIQYGHYEIVKYMIEVVDNPEILIEEPDAQLRTSLHMAAFKGNVNIVKLLLDKGGNVKACDIDDNTPLHEAVLYFNSIDEENQDCFDCIIDLLIKFSANINALNIDHESPLHIACRYGSFEPIKKLLDNNADLLETNFQGYNCLEIAIKGNNKNTVNYLIEQDYIFNLMRNAQFSQCCNKLCYTCGDETRQECYFIPLCKIIRCFRSCIRSICFDCRTIDTPMRKLIEFMPDMAYQILDKCTTKIGSEETKIYSQFYNYEFLEDQYTVRYWLKGRPCDAYKDIGKNEPYTFDSRTLVMNHPLFLMAMHDRYELMSHPLSKSLLDKKFPWCGFNILFVIFISLIYVAFLGIFTTMVLRTEHPQKYYNLTGFDFQTNLCENVTQLLGNNDVKEIVDYGLQKAMYVLFVANIVKNAWFIFIYITIDQTKILTFTLEIISLVCNVYFLIDQDYQKNYRMRCPIQWQLGAYGLFSGYLALFYYIQYVPVLGNYVIMMKRISIRFVLFLPVLTILICAFTFPLYMIFQNFRVFNDLVLSLAKIVIMSTGELNYDDLVYNETTIIYYKVGFFLLVVFAIAMTVLATNLLIGLAVGEVTPMMKMAKNIRLDTYYELVADLEIVRYQSRYLFNLFYRCFDQCRFFFISPKHYGKKDMKKLPKWCKYLKKRLLESCAREVEDNDSSNESEQKEDDHQTQILRQITKTTQTIKNSLSIINSENTIPHKITNETKYNNEQLKKTIPKSYKSSNNRQHTSYH